MNKKIRVSFAILASLAVISCSVPINTIKNEINNTNQYSNITNIIKGKVNFPQPNSTFRNTGEKQFSTKVTIGDIGNRATVSLIYPPDDATNPNVTIATGLTDSSGAFAINTNFTPVTNKVYILEATKRIGSSGNNLMSVRTYLRHNGSSWESITGSTVNINSITTAITIIDSYDNSISSSQTINTVSGSTPSNIGSVNVSVINNVKDIVTGVLNNDRDPVRFISFQNNEYFILKENSYNKNYLLTDKSCPNCDLTNEDISNQNLSNSDLSNANLTNTNLSVSNLSNANLSGANLTDTNFSNATWINGTTTCFNGSFGKCFFPDILVNSYTTNSQQNSRIAMDNAGNFVVVWLSQSNQDGSGGGVYAQRYNSSGVAQIPSGCSAPTCNPATGEFRVNTYTTNSQANPSVAIDSTGNFVISWTSQNQDGSSAGVYAQRYNNAGIPQIPSGCGTTIANCNSTTGEFRVNTYTTNNQQYPSVAMDSTGNFVVTWYSYNQNGSNDDIYAQRYNNAGIPQIPSGCGTTIPNCNSTTGEFRVNSYTTNSQNRVIMAMDNTGNFVVTWTSLNQDGDNSGIYAQRYNSSGIRQIPSGCSLPTCNPTTGEFKVNTITTNAQYLQHIGMDNSGNFVVTWTSLNQDGDNNGVYAQRYNNAGIPQIPTGCGTTFPNCNSTTGEFRVNSYTTDQQSFSSVAIDNIGNFILTWMSLSQDGSNNGVFAQRYNNVGIPQIPSGCALPACNPTTGEFRVNAFTTNLQGESFVAIDNTGNFVITWTSTEQEGLYSNNDVYIQKYDNAGNYR